MAHVYLSYTPRDQPFAEYLLDRLEGAGIRAVVDGERLRAGLDWCEDIDRAIDDAYAVIVIMSPSAKLSESVTYEWTYALGIRKCIIPILLKPAGIQLHPQLSMLPTLDFTGDFAPWEDLIEYLREAEIEYNADRLVGALHHPAWETRMVVAEILGDRGDPAVIPALAEALYDGYVEVRLSAVKALAKLEHPAAVPYLAEALHNNAADARIASAWALGKIGDPGAASSLVRALRDPDTRIRWNAAWALGEIGAPAVPGLIKALRDPDGRVRGTAAGALASIGVPGAVPELVLALRDEKWTVREAAARALAQLKDPAAVHGLIEALRDHDERVRGTAGAALAAIGAPAVPALTQALYDEDTEVRLAAAGALGVAARRTPEVSIPEALLGALDDPDFTVRSVVVWALGEVGDDALVPALAGVLWHDTHGSVRAAAFKALTRLDTPEARDALAAWQREAY